MLVDAGGGSALRFGESGATMSELDGEHLSAYAARVIHGSVPALAWRVEIGGKSIVFSGDTNGEGADLVHLAKDADLFMRLLSDLSDHRRRHMQPPLNPGCSFRNSVVARKSRPYRKSVRAFQAPLHLQTISIASPYGKVPFAPIGDL